MEKNLDRRTLLKGGAVLSLASVLPSNNVFAAVAGSGIDKLADKNGKFILHPLPYRTDFLEPVIDEETVYLHWKYHHGGAVKGANKDYQMILKALEENDFSTVDYWTKKFEYHFSSHVLHTIYWTNLTNKKTYPKGELLKRIERQFGTVEKLKSLLAKLSKSVVGAGWGILGYQIYTDRLVVIQCEDHHHLTQYGVIPLLAIDVWEHSYYLKYKNKRGNYVNRIMEIINWDDVARRLDAVTKLTK